MCYTIPYGMPELIFEHKHTHKNYIVKIKIYKVPKDTYEFVDEWKLIGDFNKDVEKISKGEIK